MTESCYCIVAPKRRIAKLITDLPIIVNNLRYASRQLLKNPGFTAVAVLTLALGIGANTTVFSLISTFLLHPMAGERKGELVQCYSRDKVRPDTYRAFSYPNYRDLREGSRLFSHLLACELTSVGITEGSLTRRVVAMLVSADYFSAFGVSVTKGRVFRAEEEQPGSALPVVILSYAYWTAHGADPEIIGKTLRLHNRPHTIVGVAPPEFAGVSSIMSPDLWLPLGMRDALRRDLTPDDSVVLSDRNQHCLLVAGQLKPGVSRASAEAELRGLASQLESAFPGENKDQTIDIHPFPRLTYSPSPEIGSAGRTFVVGRVIPLLLAMAGAVLLIACLNLANLLLARGTARRKEIALRLALGAKRRQVMGQLLMEAFLLSVLGGAAGLLLAFGTTRLFLSSMTSALPFVLVFDTSPDLRLLAATIGVCGLSTLLFGLGPAWRMTRPGIVADLKVQVSEPVTPAAGQSLFSMRNWLVITQLAISLTLLAAAGLFVRGAVNAAHVDPGFALRNGIVVEVDTALAGYDEVRGREAYFSLGERLRTLPGVEAMTMASSIPFDRRMWRTIRRAGVPASTGVMAESAATGKTFVADYNVIGANYFTTLGVSLVRGREFVRSEMEPGSRAQVAIIDQELARLLWPGEEALGRQMQIVTGTPRESPRPLEVVGIVPTLRNSIIETRQVAHLYVPLGHQYQPQMYFHLRVAPHGRESELTLLRTVPDEIHSLDARLSVLTLKTLADLPKRTQDLWLVQAGAEMFLIFGALALILALIGIYGVKSFTVARRTREIGIRIALGATTRNILRQVMREGLILTTIGLAFGVLLAVPAGLLLRGLLYGVSPVDPLVLCIALFFLTTAASLACYIPARRAAKVDPLVALRTE